MFSHTNRQFNPIGENQGFRHGWKNRPADPRPQWQPMINSTQTGAMWNHWPNYDQQFPQITQPRMFPPAGQNPWMFPQNVANQGMWEV